MVTWLHYVLKTCWEWWWFWLAVCFDLNYFQTSFLSVQGCGYWGKWWWIQGIFLLPFWMVHSSRHPKLCNTIATVHISQIQERYHMFYRIYPPSIASWQCYFNQAVHRFTMRNSVASMLILGNNQHRFCGTTPSKSAKAVCCCWWCPRNNRLSIQNNRDDAHHSHVKSTEMMHT